MSAAGPASGLGARIVGPRRRSVVSGVAASLLAVAVATLAVSGLQRVAPVVSLGVVYLPAVLLVSISWGAAQGLFCALLSAAAFNFFHLPPTGRFTIADGRNWVSLAAFVVVALVVSAVAELARARAVEAERGRREATLAAAMARELLGGEDSARALQSTARRIAETFGLAAAAIHLGSDAGGSSGHGLVLPLRDADGEAIGELDVPADLDAGTGRRLREEVAPTLGALVAVARRRDALAAERVQTEALRRSDDIKTALLRAVSHDLRSPLTAIVAAGHALGSASLEPDERVELSGSVVSEGRRLSDLVDKLLDLSRLQSGAAPPRADWVSVEELVAAAADSRGTPPIDYRLAVEDGVPAIRADAAQIERALANLLENADRYGGAAPVHVRVRSAGDRVIIAVVDRGPGIAPAEQPRIFEPFYRGAGASAVAGTGSGLGLAIARGFVEANGGSISVRSLPGQGTSFQVALPVATTEPTVPA